LKLAFELKALFIKTVRLEAPMGPRPQKGAKISPKREICASRPPYSFDVLVGFRTVGV